MRTRRVSLKADEERQGKREEIVSDKFGRGERFYAKIIGVGSVNGVRLFC